MSEHSSLIRQTSRVCLLVLFLVLAATRGTSATAEPAPAGDTSGQSVRGPTAEAVGPPPDEHPTLSPPRETGPQTRDPSGNGNDWFAVACEQVASLEYTASETEKGLQAPNRAHNLRTYFRESGIQVVPRISGSRAWQWSWETSSFGREGATGEVGPAQPANRGTRIEYRRDAMVEWYVNSKKGVEQGFTIPVPPPGEGRLCIEGSIAGDLRARLADPGQAVEFTDQNNMRHLRYAELHVFDTDGRELPAELTLSAQAIRILVDDRDAVYPILIDPVLTTPEWITEGNQEGARYGYCVAPAGDVNADGYGDVIVGAPEYDLGAIDGGAAFAFYGSPEGLSGLGWMQYCDQDSAWFGQRVAAAGDVNGDGYHDVLVSAMYYDNGEISEGRAYLYLGSADGIEDVPSWYGEGNQQAAFFGHSIATAGDVNGDGYDDVLVGAYNYTDDQPYEGRASLYFGSSTGLELTPSWTTYGDQSHSRYGCSVAGAGDVNADGYADVLVGASYYTEDEYLEGRAYVFLGSADGLSLTPCWHADGDQASCYFGFPVARAGDLDGDGYGDIAIGARGHNVDLFDEGRAYVFMGGPTGPEDAPWVFEGTGPGANLGGSVATAGDVNGDGLSDLLIGAPQHHDAEMYGGLAHLFYGSRNGLPEEPVWTTHGEQDWADYGNCVATAGDVNGDGFSDILIGAREYDHGQEDEGRAYLYLGSGDGPRAEAGWVIESNQSEAYFGTVASAGDVDGDGYEDVIVGAESYDFGQEDEGAIFLFMGTMNGLSVAPAWYAESDQAEAGLGHAVAGAGDVNGDGYSDILAGAPYYNGTYFDEGRAFLWLGSPTGAPMGNPENAAWTAAGSHNDAEFGTAVAAAGDVNGDGFGDVIIGIPNLTVGHTKEGGAKVYLGSESGLAPGYSWTSQSGQAHAQLGSSVASAGDVNGDGYSDVLVGAPYFDNGEDGEGMVFLCNGSADGLESAWSWYAEGNQEGAGLGFAAASAGDVNADGYSDIVVGAPFMFEGTGGFGVWLGSPEGLAGHDLWDADFADSGPEGSQSGFAVASAGDVDGNGFSDIIIGWPALDDMSGGIGVYAGCADFLGYFCGWEWSAEGGQPQAEFGCSVAAADVNGDGFSDILVGATHHDEGQSDEGRAFLYYGNDSRGLARMPEQMRSDHSAPIALLGLSDSESAFGLRALGRTAGGRGEVRMEWEVKPFGTPFDSDGIEHGTTYDTGAPVQGIGSAVVLEELVSDLASQAPYHWRLRIAAHDPFFPHTPWFSPRGNGPAEMDLRTASGGGAVWDAIPQQGRLHLAVLPNPAASQMTIRYALSEVSDVQVGVYDLQGRRIRTLVDGPRASGVHEITWNSRAEDGHPVESGVYWVRLNVGEQETSREVQVAR